MSDAVLRARRDDYPILIVLDLCEHGDWQHYSGVRFPLNCLHAVGTDVARALDIC